jgi:hypothetical protein
MTDNNHHIDDLSPKGYNLIDSLPAIIAQVLGASSELQSRIMHRGSVSPRKVTDFTEGFNWLFIFVTGAVEPGKINPDLIGVISAWFRGLNTVTTRNNDYLLVGCDLFIAFIREMQKWGIGQVFNPTPKAPYLTEDIELHQILIEDEQAEDYDIDEE